MVRAARFVTDWPVNPRMPCYTRGNAGEVLAGPASPLGWTLGFERGLLPGCRTGLIEFGLYHESELDPDRPPAFGMFGGYFYINLSHLRIMSIRMGLAPNALDEAYVGSAGSVPAYRPHPEDQCADCSARVARSMAWAMTAEDFPAVDAGRVRARVARAGRPDLRTLSAPELVARMRSFLPELATAFHRHVFTGLAATVGPAVLNQLLTEAGRPELLLDLISGWGDVDSAASSAGLWELAGSADRADEARLAAFLREYGSRGPSEWDIHAPSWESCPDLVLALLDRLCDAPDTQSPRARHDRLRGQRERATATVRSLLYDGDRDRFDTALRSASVFLPARERTKAIAVSLLNEVRMAALELGRRGVAGGHLTEPEDVTMLLESELDGYLAAPREYQDVIAERLRTFRELAELEPPFFITDQVPPLWEWAGRRRKVTHRPLVTGDELVGAPGAYGTHRGRVRVIRDLADPAALRPGEVMVAPHLDAAWVPLLMVAGAVVSDVGADNSHGVVVCRELGLPCVMSAADATERLRDGMLVTVDGAAGTVTIDAAAEGGTAVTDDDTLVEVVVRGGRQESTLRPKLMAWYDRFLVINHELRAVCTQWQCRPDGRPNDHSDAVYDAHVRDRLADIHDRITPVLAALTEGVPRLGRYLGQLRTAMDQLAAGDTAWFTSPTHASYHTVWMRVHQELLLALGISRAADAEREQDLVREAGELFTSGLGVSAGIGSGRIVLSVEEAVELAGHAVPVVLVTPETTPADLPGIRVAAAVLTSRGGSTSHAAVVARGLGIPVVCGANQLRIGTATVTAGGRTLAAGDLISVDGTSGAVYLGDRPADRPATTVAARPPVADVPNRLRVLANADTAADARTALACGAAGIGLCRSEHQLPGHGLALLRRVVTAQDPGAADELAESQRAAFRELFGVAGARQVTVRLLDAPAHEFLATPGEPSEWDEANPMLGTRGVRLAVVRPELYRVQARAIMLAWTDIARTGPAPDLGIMIPMVSLPTELAWAANHTREVASDITEQTGAHVPYRLGCMVETPRAALVADQLAETADFLCFGTNDLTQLTYGFSRDDIERAILVPYQRSGLLTDSPFTRLDTDGVAALLTIAVEKARTVRPDIELGLCGEHGADPRSLACCERLGLNYVSCSLHQIPTVLHATTSAPESRAISWGHQ